MAPATIRSSAITTVGTGACGHDFVVGRTYSLGISSNQYNDLAPFITGMCYDIVDPQGDLEDVLGGSFLFVLVLALIVGMIFLWHWQRAPRPSGH